MRKLSVYEDFVQVTLAALRTAWERLDFIGSIHRDGRYVHWGLARTYGAEATQEAIGRAHSEVAGEVLRIPVTELLRELERKASAVTFSDYTENLRINAPALIPAALSPWQKMHFESVLLCLSRVAAVHPTRRDQAA
jgi:hypothetical protein